MIQESDRQQERAISVVRGAFREYYFRHSSSVEAPDRIEQREFGYARFGERGMMRHLSFSSAKELVATLVKEVPSDVYCSNACYRFPTYPMQEKQWLGASLIFDIDGKDLGLPCVPSHSYPVCSECGHASAPEPEAEKNKSDGRDKDRGRSDLACPACNGRKVEQVSIPCAKCIEGSKKEVRRLLSLLTEDLAIGRESIHIYFSGNNGFHVHVSDSAYEPLDSQARSDLAGYIAGIGLMAESIGVRKANADGLAYVKFPRSGLAYGWKNKIAEKLKIDTGSAIRLGKMVEQKGGYAGFKADLDRMAREMGARIDPQVTTDVHRVFRMPGTLNSKSGLAKARCASDLDSFDPLVEACLLGESKVEVRVKAPVRLKLKGKSFSLSKKESAELPAYAAVYLVCKNLAGIIVA